MLVVDLILPVEYLLFPLEKVELIFTWWSRIDDVQNNDYVQVTFMKNGSRVGPYARTWAPDQNDQIIDANLTTIMNLSAGDTVNFQVYHTGNATEPTEENRCFFGGYRLAV